MMTMTMPVTMTTKRHPPELVDLAHDVYGRLGGVAVQLDELGRPRLLGEELLAAGWIAAPEVLAPLAEAPQVALGWKGRSSR